MRVVCKCGEKLSVSSSKIQKIQCPNCHRSMTIDPQKIKEKTRHSRKTKDGKITPRKIKNYKVVRQIGHGGMGTVYEVIDIYSQKHYALKLLPQSSPTKNFERFRREAQALSSLHHPGIVHFIDDDIEGQHPFIVTALVDGQSLKEITKPMPSAQALEIVYKIADALRHAHESNIIHRDIKPSNIMLTKSNEPCVLDFGIAKLMDSETSLTKSNARLGTPRYMSPEQIRAQKREIDHRTDIYSLGCVLYELLTGKPVVAHRNMQTIMRAIVEETPILPSNIMLDLPTHMDKICMKALEKNSDKRYQTMTAFQEALRMAMETKQPRSITQHDTAATENIALKQNTNVDTETRQPENAMPHEFGPYRLIKELGRGGMGVVYEAVDMRTNKKVALKRLLFATERDSNSFVRFRREAQSISQLQHKHIVAFHEVGNEPQPYIAMEFIHGKTLAQVIREQQMSTSQMMDILIRVGEALHDVHSNGMIHRDIKPENIMIDKDGHPKLMDFGLARVNDETQGVTRTGDIIGTPAYMSPQQINGEKIDHRADIYSLGATLYEVLTKRRPFAGNEWQIMSTIFTEDPIAPCKLNKNISERLSSICMRCLHKEPAKRYQSVKMFVYDLHGLKNLFREEQHYQKKYFLPLKAVLYVSLIAFISAIACHLGLLSQHKMTAFLWTNRLSYLSLLCFVMATMLYLQPRFVRDKIIEEWSSDRLLWYFSLSLFLSIVAATPFVVSKTPPVTVKVFFYASGVTTIILAMFAAHRCQKHQIDAYTFLRVHSLKLSAALLAIIFVYIGQYTYYKIFYPHTPTPFANLIKIFGLMTLFSLVLATHKRAQLLQLRSSYNEHAAKLFSSAKKIFVIFVCCLSLIVYVLLLFSKQYDATIALFLLSSWLPCWALFQVPYMKEMVKRCNKMIFWGLCGTFFVLCFLAFPTILSLPKFGEASRVVILSDITLLCVSVFPFAVLCIIERRSTLHQLLIKSLSSLWWMTTVVMAVVMIYYVQSFASFLICLMWMSIAVIVLLEQSFFNNGFSTKTKMNYAFTVAFIIFVILFSQLQKSVDQQIDKAFVELQSTNEVPKITQLYNTIPTAQNAAYVFENAFEKIDKNALENVDWDAIFSDKQLNSENTQDIRAALLANKEALTILQKAVAIPRCCYAKELDFASCHWHEIYYSLKEEIGQASRLFVLRAIVEAKDNKKALRSLQQAMQCANSVENDPTLLSVLSQVLQQKVVLQSCAWLLNNRKFDDYDLQQLLSLSSYDIQQRLEKAMAMEFHFAVKAAIALRNNLEEREMLGEEKPSPVVKVYMHFYFNFYLMQGFDDYVVYQKAILQQMQKPLQQRMLTINDNYIKEQQIFPFSIIAVRYDDLEKFVIRHRLYREVLQTVLLIERYRLKYNRLPRTLQEVAEEYSYSVFRDIDGKPLRYKISTTNYRVFSTAKDELDTNFRKQQRIAIAISLRD
ncbi:serine/threonine protein kinase [Candidatus Uabimicrobium amorphum]|uniref:non-specific serine/threonine protein kinase n=1 Tax=Uabimicrobium amorphum TaxID=2596890 RepID=A0A5S9ISC2_UABAM|nr:serine/threonine-protein kinase [Candidatus Uabimicrobium amorphum]BBM86531.1 putative serine/threonine-protein kinase PknB [Candidatus Uabimicrobium amorphum]